MTTSGTISSYNILPSGYTWGNVGSIASDPSGNIWFNSCMGNGSSGYMALGELNTSTHSVSVYTYYTGAGCSYQAGPTAVSPDGNHIWVSETDTTYGTTTLKEFSPSGSLQQSYSSGPIYHLNSLAFGSDGNLWGGSSINANMYKFTVSSSTHSITGTSSYATTHIPGSITAGPDGALWFTEHDANKVGRLGY